MTDALTILSRYIFEGVVSTFGKMRVKLALWILPKDVSNFANLIVSKMANDIQKMDSEKRNKISAIRIDFEFRN
jgi:hypothetical protein